jgi:hypothetical protein
MPPLSGHSSTRLQGRARWYTKADYLVECQDCGWTALGVRTCMGLAAQHHDHTGHVVRVEETRVHYYGEDAPGKRRWWKGRQ